MNTLDKKLIIWLLIISLIFICFLLFTKKDGNIALVYYDNQLIKTVPLDIDNIYLVQGELGDVIIEVKNNKIKVEDENSPKHLCSKQGFVSSSYESIVCLPNKIVIKIKNRDDIDTLVK